MARGRLGLFSLVALGLACICLPQGVGWNQNAHYALIRSLAGGSAVIDSYRAETGDVAWVDGHYYSTKAPGLAFVTLPAYVALDLSGSLDVMAMAPGVAGEAVGALWALGLVGCVLPALLMLLLIRRLAELVVPGYGTAGAIALGAGTLLLPFSTLFFAHVLSAALGFAAFGLVWLERERRPVPRPAVVGVAGFLAGFAVVTHYSLAVLAGIVGVYVLSTSPRFRNALLYLGGAIVGLLALALYDWWTFGSPFHLSYRDAVLVGGVSGHDVIGANAAGFFGMSTPRAATAFDLLFGHIGLVTLAPLVAAAAVGVLFLWRIRRAEAAVVAAIAIAFVGCNAGYVDPFGGFSPGPRFLIPVLPFLGVPLALALRRIPATTIVLAAISIALMVAVTITQPLLAHDGRWHERIENGSFGGHGPLPVLPLALLVLVAASLAARALPRWRITAFDATAAVVASGAWLVLFLTTPGIVDGHGWREVLVAAGVLAAAAALSAFAAALHLVARGTLDIPDMPAAAPDPVG